MAKSLNDISGIVNILDKNGASVGTGFFASPNGHILTCYHVLEAISTSVFDMQFVNYCFMDSTKICRAQVISFDCVSDIAILCSNLKTEAYLLVGDYELNIGDMFLTTGFPLGNKHNIYSYPTFMGKIENGLLLQLGNANEIVPGFSGAPLINRNHQVVGMIVSVAEEKCGRFLLLASAIPAEIILKVYGKILYNDGISGTKIIAIESDGISAYKQFIKDKTDNIGFKGIESMIGTNVTAKTLKLYAPLYIKNVHGISDSETTLQEFVAAERGIIIKGNPGAGKSTFLKYMIRNELEMATNVIPFLISLDSLGSFIKDLDINGKQGAANILIEYILQEYPQRRFGFNFDILEEIFSQGLGWLFFDGFDEIDSENEKEKVSSLISYVFDYWNCKFVITSRPYALDEYNHFKDFQKIHIDTLHIEQIEKYINNLAQIININQYIIDANGLINIIRSKQSINELARTPVMLTFICFIYFLKDEIPENRFEIIEKIIAWLIKAKYKVKEKQDDIMKKYASIAREMFDGSNSKKEIEADILYAKYGEKQSKKTFLDTLKEVGIIVKNNENNKNEKYSFWHFCFEEYLVAKSLFEYAPVDNDYLLAHWFDQDWREVIVFYSICQLKSGVYNMVEFIDFVCGYLLSLDLNECIKGASLLGTIFKEVYPNTDFLNDSTNWNALKRKLEIVFRDELPHISVKDKCNAATAYGLSGDERLFDFDKTFVSVSGGHYFMGAQNLKPYRRKFDLKATEFEWPVKEVFIEGFEIRKYPITVEEFERFINDDGYMASKEIWTEEGIAWREDGKIKYPRNWRQQIYLRNSPVTGVSWFEAMAYCNWLTANSQGRYYYRLPSETQWEYAYHVLCRMERIDTYKMNCYENLDDIQTKTPIGIFPSSTSQDGLTDMLGNVEEWCRDSWCTSLYNCPLDGSAMKNMEESGAVTRGGSTIRTRRLCRYTYRARCNKNTRYDTIGFRIIRQER